MRRVGSLYERGRNDSLKKLKVHTPPFILFLYPYVFQTPFIIVEY